MISFLSSPKPFRGRDAANQIRAIKSWQKAVPDGEVILYGNSEGTSEVCRDLGVTHVPEISSSPSGVPYFNAIADHAAEMARHDRQIYTNCDIILSPSISSAIYLPSFTNFLLVGQRIDLAENVNWDINEDFVGQIRNLAQNEQAKLADPCAIDYFGFPRGQWKGLKPLVVGRAGYDLALVKFCLSKGIPVIDATYAVSAIHQYHAYNHVKNGTKEVFHGADAYNNRRVHGVIHSTPNTSDANWRILGGDLIRTKCRGDWLRYLELQMRFTYHLNGLGLLLRAAWRILRSVNIYHKPVVHLDEVLREISVYEKLERELNGDIHLAVDLLQ